MQAKTRRYTPTAPSATALDIVKKIEVIGTYYAPKSSVYNELTLKPGSEADPIALDVTIKNIQSLGLFSDVSGRYVKGKTGLTAVFYVTENARISDIQFTGVTLFEASFLLAQLSSKVNEIINVKTIHKDIEVIAALYKEKGYIAAKVVNVQPPEKEGDPLVFSIAEGVVEAIVITGNKVTRPYVITREMDTKPGSALNDKILKEDLRKVYNLSYFTELKPTFLDGTTKNSQILQLDLTEKGSFGSFTFGGGYSGTSGLSIFTDLYWDNLAGTGQLVMFKLQRVVGNNPLNTFQFKYVNPWMWDKRKSLSVKAWLTDGQVESSNPLGGGGLSFINERSYGTEWGLGWPISYELKTFHYVKLEKVHLIASDKRYSIASYRFVISYDTRDVAFNPTEGQFHSFSTEHGLIPFSESLEFTRFDLDLRRFFKTFEQQTIAARLSFGLITSPRIDDTDLFSREYYRVGGSNTVRGYDDFHPFAVGDKQVLASLEYRFLFNDVFQLVFFVDAGYATKFIDPLDSTVSKVVSPFDISKYKVGKGIGTRINVPMLGPLRLDFGISETGDSRFHFNIGHTF